MKMTQVNEYYQWLIVEQEELNADNTDAGLALSNYCNHKVMGLTCDNCKSSEEHKALNSEFNASFAKLREFNSVHATEINKYKRANNLGRYRKAIK